LTPRLAAALLPFGETNHLRPGGKYSNFDEGVSLNEYFVNYFVNRLTTHFAYGTLALVMSIDITGPCKLVAWRGPEEDEENATGLLIYTPDFQMAVQMVAADRPTISSDDPLSGDVDQPAAAYSTCPTYFGTMRRRVTRSFITRVASLYPNWYRRPAIPALFL
jgi:hypothetical protein